MIFRILADLVVIAHFLWILFLVFGFFAGGRFRPMRALHLTGLGFAVISQIFGWYCPLTYLEVWLRKQHDPSLGYAGSFIIYYLERVIYIQLMPVMIFLMTLALCAFSVWYYFLRKKGR